MTNKDIIINYTNPALGTSEEKNHFIRESEEEYEAERYRSITSHSLNVFSTDPMMFLHKYIKLKVLEKHKEYFIFGRAVHSYFLEGHNIFDSKFTISERPINEKTMKPFGKLTKTYLKWKLEKNENRTVLEKEEFFTLGAMYESFRSHPIAYDLIRDEKEFKGAPELVLRTPFFHGKKSTFSQLQCRIDFMNEKEGLIEFKTCRCLNKFEYDAIKFGHLRQVAFYTFMLRKCFGINVPVHIIAIEKKAPYTCAVWKVSERILDYWMRDIENNLDNIQKCINSILPWNFKNREVRSFSEKHCFD